MEPHKRAFLSYSHQDRVFAERLAKELQATGIEVWWDRWEIQPGDSLVDRVFREGLQCDVFVVLLSPASTSSRWVQEELDHAMVRRMEGVTRIIPVLIEECAIPAPLRPLMYVDLSGDKFGDGLRQIVKCVHEVTEKPPIGRPPQYVTELRESTGGLSRVASTIAYVIMDRGRDAPDSEVQLAGGDVQQLVPSLSASEINDAVSELQDYGLVRVVRYIASGTAPYSFGWVSPTYALFLHFKDAGLDYDPMEDIRSTASALANCDDSVWNSTLQKLTQLPPRRLSRAVSYLGDMGVVEVTSDGGAAPYSFKFAKPTWRTRQFVAEECR